MTTTDDFDTAAREEARRAWEGEESMTMPELALHMAEWARIYLAEHEASETEAGAARKLRKIRKLNDRYSLSGMVPCDEIDKVLDPD